MKLRALRKQVRKIEKKVLTVTLQEILVTTKQKAENLSREINTSLAIDLQMILGNQLKFNSSWISQCKWIDDINLLSVIIIESTNIIKVIGILWWGQANYIKAGLVPEPFEAILKLSNHNRKPNVFYSLKFGLPPYQYCVHKRREKIKSHLTMPILEVNSDFSRKKFFLTVCEGDMDSIQRFINLSVDINTNQQKLTPLMAAVILGHSEVVKKLIESGAKINNQTTNGLSALELAAQLGYIDIVKLLLVDVDVMDKHVQAALHWAFHGVELGQVVHRPYKQIITLLENTRSKVNKD